LRQQFWICAPYAFLLALMVSGCGPSRSDVSGKITHQQKSLAVGSIVIAGGDGSVKSAQINPDGTFLVKDIVVGTITATVTSPDPAEKKFVMRKKDAEVPPEKEAKSDPRWFPIPADYGDFEKSGLTFQLKRGPNTWDIDLK
jgi:hypothetical protein